MGVQEGTAAIFVLGHGHRAQVDKIKAVGPLALPEDHTPATKPRKRPWPVDLVATQGLVPRGRRSGRAVLSALEYESTDWD